MKIKLFFLYLILAISVPSLSQGQDYELDDMGISVEKFDKENKNENRFTENNKIYKVNRRFTYNYYYENYLQQKSVYTKDSLNSTGVVWKLVELGKATASAVTNVVLTVFEGQKPFSEDYNQTIIRYQYDCQNGTFLASEKTGVIENEKNTWIHPPRTHLFRILELNPFPYIKAPYKIGTKWKWSLQIGEHWGDERWIKWKGNITNECEYEITAIKEIKFGAKNITCFEVKATAQSELGETSLIAYFNEDVGFVKLEYTNIDNTKLVLELQK